MTSAGIYGGNFDPVHIGHLITAKHIQEKRKLDKIIFVPAFISPFKQDIKSSSASHRLNMLKIAIKGINGFFISDYEIKKESVSYTIDTLRFFKQQYDHLELIIGYDNLLEFTEWKEPDEIVNLVQLVVLKRKSLVNSNYEENRFFKNSLFADTPLIEISSTEIRSRIKNNLSIDFLVTEEVKQYIIKNNLYKEEY